MFIFKTSRVFSWGGWFDVFSVHIFINLFLLGVLVRIQMVTVVVAFFGVLSWVNINFRCGFFCLYTGGYLIHV